MEMIFKRIAFAILITFLFLLTCTIIIPILYWINTGKNWMEMEVSFDDEIRLREDDN